jgi:hypothetical protein
MSIYGEGLYRDADGKLVQDAERQPRTSEGRAGTRSTRRAAR